MKQWFEDKAEIEKYVLPLQFSEENYTVALLAAIILLSIKEKKAALMRLKAGEA